MQAYFKYKAYHDKKQTLQSSKKQTKYMSCSRKQIIKGAEFLLRNCGGMALILLKRCYGITIIWYPKWASTRNKCYIACDCFSSHVVNPYLIYESRHKNGNLIQKWASNTMICMPERGSVDTKSHFMTPKIIAQHQANNQKFQFSLIYQPRKHGTHQEPNKSVPEKFFLKRTIYVT